jgi:hypothetical protein
MFQRFEKVIVANQERGEFAGQRGTVIWCDPPWFDRRVGAWREWVYSVHVPGMDCYRSFLESDLEPTGEFDAEEVHRGRRFEISYDCRMSDDMRFVEGCYRLPGRHWQVFLFSNKAVPELRHGFGTWESEVTGVESEVPEGVRINHDFIVRAMSKVFGSGSWSASAVPIRWSSDSTIGVFYTPYLEALRLHRLLTRSVNSRGVSVSASRDRMGDFPRWGRGYSTGWSGAWGAIRAELYRHQ